MEKGELPDRSFSVYLYNARYVLIFQMRKHVLILLLSILYLEVHGQVKMNKDSLLRLLPAVQEDSAGVEYFISLGQQYETSETELAKHYYKKAGEISEKIGYPTGIVQSIFNYTYVLNLQGRYDSGLVMNQKAVDIARTLNEPVLLGKALFNTGTSYRQLSQYGSAIPYFEEGRGIFEKIGDSLLFVRAYDVLQLLYYNLEDYDKAIAYGESAVKGLRSFEDTVWLGAALSNLGMSYASKGELNKAKLVWMEALAIGKSIGDLEMEGTQMINLGDLYMNTGEYAAIRQYYGKALELYTKLDGAEGIAISLRGMANYEFYNKEFEAAKQYANRSLDVINKNNLLFQKRKTLETLSRIHIALHDLAAGQQYMKMATVITDSINNERIRRNTIEFETKYQTEKKDAQIKLQQADIKQRKTLNFILIGGAVSLLTISLLGYRNYRHKQQVQLQRINELEKERYLSATEAVLKGEEQERTRLAKDLHDGLGGMLSGIKHALNTMKENLIMTPDNAQAFARSMDMLDSSIQEMRRVAHNMMPETLVKFGLDAALRDFCNDITNSGALQVKYQSLQMEGVDIDPTIAITTYRIVQELINNTIKHASAQNALVQISRTDGRLDLEVEDDGKGFDTAMLDQGKGIGWSNIQHRVAFLKGTLDIHSDIGKGTFIHIELNT
jgi:two-component system, NarL family, sensor kinase